MTTTISPSPKRPSQAPRSRRPRARSSLLARGEPMVWVTGGALICCIAMILGLLAIVVVHGSQTFLVKPIVRIETRQGEVLMGEQNKEEIYTPTPDQQDTRRRMLRTGNYELTQVHFRWVSDFEVASEDLPEWATLLERLDWGRFYGFPTRFVVDGKTVATGARESWAKFEEHHETTLDRRGEKQDLKDGPLAAFDDDQRAAQKTLKLVEIDSGFESDAYHAAQGVYDAHVAAIEKQRVPLRQRIAELEQRNDAFVLVMTTADGTEQPIRIADVVRGYQPNRLGFLARSGVYVSRWWEFLSENPREANSEGGVFPAIFGTIVMTLLMVVFVVPFGVLAALYLREYAKQGPLVSLVRIAVNNLAGVPSIVYGVFGLGFFCYIVGAQIDGMFFAADLSDGNPTFGKGGIMWASATLALLTLPVVIVATEEALAAVPRSMREGSYACGASKWQTIHRIVLPRAMPGIMTGAILALARGAGEVAPLMLVGAAKVAPALPIDGEFPFLHPERSFMHLGFHIYDVGFQSQNSEAARPLVFTTTLLLIAIVVALNALAIWVRARLRRKLHA